MTRRLALAACLALTALTAYAAPAAANSAPLCSDAEYSTPKNTPLTISGACADPEGQPLSYSIVPNSGPSPGTLTITSPSSVKYTPLTDFVGTDGFRYAASDGTNTTEARVTLTVVDDDGVNTGPQCPKIATFVVQDTPTVLQANCIDPDGDALVFTVLSSFLHSPLIGVASDAVLYKPEPGYTGPDSISYRATDGQAVTPDMTADISVVPATAGTFSSGTSPSATEPAVASVTTTEPGRVEIREASTLVAPPSGYEFLDFQFNIVAPDGNPLVLAFTIDDAAVPAGQDENTIEVFRDGIGPIANCTATLTPDPCVAERTLLAGGDISLVVQSSHASRWNFGTALTPPKRGKGCGDKNHAHAREGGCKKPAK